MDWGRGASKQYTPSPEPYPIPRSPLLSGTQVRGFKHNPRTCPCWTLDPCKGRDLSASLGRVPAVAMCFKVTQQWLPMLLSCQPEIWPRHYPLGVGGRQWAVSAHPDHGSKRSKFDPSAGPYEGRCEASSPVPFLYQPPRGTMQLLFPRIPGILAPGCRHGGSGCQNGRNRPSQVADQGSLSWQSRLPKS